jgi:two-component system NtrC family sensor kinase
VTDNGIGIAEEIHDRLFEPFFTTKRAEHGTGLGLSISRAIVEDFGGTIELRSGETEGASAIITLPVGSAPEETGA